MRFVLSGWAVPSLPHINKQGMQCTCNVALRRVLVTIVAVGKQWVLHILSVCSLVIHHTLRTRHIVIYGMSGCAIFLHIIS